MKLVVGLGNPGKSYAKTRHNVGFWLVEELARRWSAGGLSAPKVVKGQHAWVTEVYFLQEKVLLVQPQTFMNRSGQAVASLMKFYSLDVLDLLVIHDDLALAPRTFRLKTGGGTGGHRGLQSIDECSGAAHRGYHRLRVGIGHPSQLGRGGAGSETFRASPLAPSDYVLQAFSSAEWEGLQSQLPSLLQACELVLQGKIQEAMNQFHGAQGE